MNLAVYKHEGREWHPMRSSQFLTFWGGHVDHADFNRKVDSDRGNRVLGHLTHVTAGAGNQDDLRGGSIRVGSNHRTIIPPRGIYTEGPRSQS